MTARAWISVGLTLFGVLMLAEWRPKIAYGLMLLLFLSVLVLRSDQIKSFITGGESR